MRTRSGRASVALAIFLSLLVPARPAFAGTVYDYPEFPYAHTDYTEPYRGHFHFSPRGGWMNDINAPLYDNGTYHLFYQHNPHGLTWDTMHWGHAVSTDLVHWTPKPIALEPGVHPGDLWSGAGVIDANNTSGLGAGSMVVFTGTNGVAVNYSTDGAKTFHSYQNGLKVVTPGGVSRDPKVLWHAASNSWVMVIWSDNGGNGVDIYTSSNLLDWTFRSRYAAGWLVEVPDLFALAVDNNTSDVRWVLTDASGEYVVGTFDGATFATDWTAPQRMDHGNNSYFGTFYGGLTFANMPDGRVVQMVWMPGNQGSTWTGNASFPAELALRSYPEGIRITRTPIGEIDNLRTSTTTVTNHVVSPDPATDPLRHTIADTYDIIAEFDTAGATADRFGFKLHARADGTFDRAVTYDRAMQTLYGAPLAPIGGRVKTRLLVDRGQLEIFGNDGKLSITDNVNFDSSPESLGVQVYAEGGSVTLVSLQFHHLASAWGTGESTLAGNLAGPWRAAGGTWTDVADGKQGNASGDGFYLSTQTGSDFTYEGDVRLDTAVAAAITFRTNIDATQHYTANVDRNGLVKLWRPGRDIGIYYTPIVAGRNYHLKVIATGPSIKVYFDHSTTPVIEGLDSAYSGGYFGINIFSGTASVQNTYVNAPGLLSNVAGPWRAVSGQWTVPGAGLHGRHSGDGFLLSSQSGGDFSYEADLSVINGRAASLTFRATADATGYYTANIDTDGYVKLWRPGRDIAVHPTAIQEAFSYHLKVVATGPSLKVYLDGAMVIDAFDSTYSSGLFGTNVFLGSALIQNITVT